ncbi:MAG: flagellar biosynthetic protein FlhB [Planctomycetota bacterium]|jgi:flagellar biosynthetic protein FlhB
MAEKDEKTEEATPKKKSDSRQEGQVAMSQEFLAALMLIAMGVSMFFSGSMLSEAAGGQMTRAITTIGDLGTQELMLEDWAAYFASRIEALLGPLAVVVLPVIGVGVLAGYGQVGFVIAAKAVEVKPDKLSPAKGIEKVISKQAFVKTVMAALKIMLVMSAVGAVTWSQVGHMSAMAGGDVGPMIAGAGRLIVMSAAAGVLVIFLLSIIDLFYQRHHMSESQKMTKQEVKDEHKNAEGDPHIKAKIRGVQREVAMRRMMEDVPDATVIVTNPTHYAVAIRYDRGSENAAPRIVAKGVDAVAQNIKRIGKENNVPLYENRPLARALHARADIGDEVPEDMFQAVAQVLAYVYRLQQEVPARA